MSKTKKKNKPFYSMHVNDGVAEIKIYDVIDEYWGVSGAGFIEELEALGNVNIIKVRISSPGGSVEEGFLIYNALKDHKARINVIIDSKAYSMASVIAMAGDHIQMSENATFMVHNPWTFTYGEANELRKTADILDKLKNNLARAYRKQTGHSFDEISSLMDAETWMEAEEALEQGFIDEIITHGEPIEPTQDLSQYGFMNIPKFLKKASNGTASFMNTPKHSNKADNGTNQGGQTMPEENTTPKITRSYLADNHANLVKDIFDEGLKAGMKTGAETERNRIKSVEQQALAGHEDLVNELKYDGKTTGEQTAVKILAAEKQKRKDKFHSMQDDAPNPVNQPPNNGLTGGAPNSNLSIEDQCKAKWNKDNSLKDDFLSLDAYVAYSKASEKGLTKISGGQ